MWASLVAQMVKNLLAMLETRVWSLGWEDPLEEEMATYSSILAWRIPWTEEPGWLQSMGSQKVRHDWVTKPSTHTNEHSTHVLCLVIQSSLTLCDPWTVAPQAPMSMGFSRQEYWSEFPCPPPGDCSNPGIKPRSPALAGGFFTTKPSGKPS